MLTDEQRTFLDRLPLSVMANVIADYASDGIAMTIGVCKPMRTAEPLDLFDYASSRIRARVSERIRALDPICRDDVGDGSTVYDDRPRPGAVSAG